MSWKLTKKLKEASFVSAMGFSSSSSSKHKSGSHSTASSRKSSEEKSKSSFDSSRRSMCSDAYGNVNVQPGLLQVRITEARGLKLPPAFFSSKSASRGFDSTHDSANAWMFPYIVVEFDKSEVVVNALRTSSPENPCWDYQATFDVSRYSQLSVNIYQRPPPRSLSIIKGDAFLGGVKLSPSFITNKMTDEWVTLQGGKGELHVQVLYKPNQKTDLSIESFELLKVIGKGSFGKVMQVRKRDSNLIYALKTIRKDFILINGEVKHTLAERTVLAQVNNPFIVPLKFSFQSTSKLYLVLAFINGGELFHHLQRENTFDIYRAKFYTAELLVALECLHEFNIIYRDLKPENILLDYTGHIALCDFGLCKLNMTKTQRTNTFCGTPEYLAPELLEGDGSYTKVVDWWTLGVLLYEMIVGLPPFFDDNVNQMYKNIREAPLVFPDFLKDEKAKDLLRRLLERSPEKRLGSGGAAEIKNHPFFADIDWKKLVAKKLQPPFKPHVESESDTSNFDSQFTSEPALDSVVPDSHLSETLQQKFANWSYQRPSTIESSVEFSAPINLDSVNGRASP
ncbi:AGC/AKT protein kinase Gad8 [Schizosaccharomyces japonicus yFS275]|uniref:non-specific serine/threonine protein kinase n=1 Tax=Schizosaccharomyces japonicus (strain yFS275 / FY16936) TaxID=402676 RepID=B6K678_SCHJY|nr:AGC/AKT protein kinase Gad8 [Schizosaccharomyces japonicus yFS275]EEB09032.1 AGC/AKT protein kinase Gad8 [Schizosaccharomyces japonicus yFS275]